jgi:phage terminase large subunit-like protein
MLALDLARWRADPIAFIREVLVDPETGKPFELYPEEEAFLRLALTVTDDGRLPYSELLFSAPKKSGKTAFAAVAMLYVIIVLAGRHGEAFAIANDLDQAVGRVFAACVRIIECSPLLDAEAKITGSRIEFTALGSTITALSSDYAGAAGSNPNFICFDELWAYTSERSHRLWDEMVPPPTRRVTARLTVTYAGYHGESTLLESLVKRGLDGERIGTDLYRQPGMLAYITHECRAPWQTVEWRAEMRRTLRPNAYLRLIENRFVGSESEFVPAEWWDACVAAGSRPILSDPGLEAFIGVDASVKRDSTALVVTAWEREAKRVRLVCHRIWQPSPDQPLDFERTIEAAVLDLRTRFRVREVRYDPFQMMASAQRLARSGVRMVEFPQTVANLTEASTSLFDLIKGRNLIAYADDQLRLAVQRSVAVEGTRGWRIAKDKQSHKIDVVIALGMSALAAVQNGSRSGRIGTGVIGIDGKITWAGAQQVEDRPRVYIDPVDGKTKIQFPKAQPAKRSIASHVGGLF